MCLNEAIHSMVFRKFFLFFDFVELEFSNTKSLHFFVLDTFSSAKPFVIDRTFSSSLKSAKPAVFQNILKFCTFLPKFLNILLFF